MKITTLSIALLAGLLPAVVEGQGLSLRPFNCEVGAACRDDNDRGSAEYSEDTLFDCADACDGDRNCNGFEWTAPEKRNEDGDCELHTDNGQDFSDDNDHENVICCWKKNSHKSKQ